MGFRARRPNPTGDGQSGGSRGNGGGGLLSRLAGIGGLQGGYDTTAIQPDDESLLEQGTDQENPLGTQLNYTPVTNQASGWQRFLNPQATQQNDLLAFQQNQAIGNQRQQFLNDISLENLRHKLNLESTASSPNPYFGQAPSEVPWDMNVDPSQLTSMPYTPGTHAGDIENAKYLAAQAKGQQDTINNIAQQLGVTPDVLQDPSFQQTMQQAALSHMKALTASNIASRQRTEGAAGMYGQLGRAAAGKELAGDTLGQTTAQQQNAIYQNNPTLQEQEMIASLAAKRAQVDALARGAVQPGGAEVLYGPGNSYQGSYVNPLPVSPFMQDTGLQKQAGTIQQRTPMVPINQAMDSGIPIGGQGQSSYYDVGQPKPIQLPTRRQASIQRKGNGLVNTNGGSQATTAVAPTGQVNSFGTDTTNVQNQTKPQTFGESTAQQSPNWLQDVNAYIDPLTGKYLGPQQQATNGDSTLSRSKKQFNKWLIMNGLR